MENNRLSLIGKGDMRSGLSIKKLALDGYEIPGQVGIRQIASDRRGFKVVTVAFDVPDVESIEKSERLQELYELAEEKQVSFSMIYDGMSDEWQFSVNIPQTIPLRAGYRSEIGPFNEIAAKAKVWLKNI